MNLLYQPLDQFDIYFLNNLTFLNVFGIFVEDLFSFFFFFELNILNLVIYLVLLFTILYLFTLKVVLKQLKLVYSSLWQYFYEVFMFKFVLDILVSQVGKRGQAYVIYIATLFYFILFSNLIGLIPFSFTITSHISLTFMLGASSIIALTIIGFYKQNLHFLELFVPKGVPQALVPLLVVIEVISYVARGFSLAIRLFANLMAGHSLLHILLLFITKIFKFNYIFGFIGLIIILAIFLLEIGISFLQAYVFIVLVSIYLKDSFEVAH